MSDPDRNPYENHLRLVPLALAIVAILNVAVAVLRL